MASARISAGHGDSKKKDSIFSLKDCNQERKKNTDDQGLLKLSNESSVFQQTAGKLKGR